MQTTESKLRRLEWWARCGLSNAIERRNTAEMERWQGIALRVLLLTERTLGITHEPLRLMIGRACYELAMRRSQR